MVFLLGGCSARLAHVVHWSHDFANDRRAPVASAMEVRAASLRYVRQDVRTADRYLLEEASVVASGKIWLVSIPLRQGGEPGERQMAIRRNSGRIERVPLK